MKYIVHLPFVGQDLDDSITDAVWTSIDRETKAENTDAELDCIAEGQEIALGDFLKTLQRWPNIFSIEVDTEAGTAKLIRFVGY